MAWVRPRHPKKEPVDPVEAYLPMLSFFGGRRPPARPKSKPKAKQRVALSRDPILRSLQQAQALHVEEPTISYSHKAPTRQSHEEHLVHEDDHELNLENESEPEEYHARMTQRSVRQLMREPSPPPPPPPPPPAQSRIIRTKPRAPSYDRPVPQPIVKDRPSPTRVPPSRRNREESTRVISSRWVSATTPLDL